MQRLFSSSLFLPYTSSPKSEPAIIQRHQDTDHLAGIVENHPAKGKKQINSQTFSVWSWNRSDWLHSCIISTLWLSMTWRSPEMQQQNWSRCGCRQQAQNMQSFLLCTEGLTDGEGLQEAVSLPKKHSIFICKLDHLFLCNMHLRPAFWENLSHYFCVQRGWSYPQIFSSNITEEELRQGKEFWEWKFC